MKTSRTVILSLFFVLLLKSSLLAASATPGPNTGTDTATSPTPKPITSLVTSTTPKPSPIDKNQIKLEINSQLVDTDVAPIIIEGRTLVPLRIISEKMGATVDWDSANRLVHITLKNINLTIPIGKNVVTVNDSQVNLDVSARILDDRTIVPIRFISENLNSTVEWDADNRIVKIDRSNINKIQYLKNTGKDTVKISMDSYRNYKAYTLTDPNRIVLEFTNINIPAELTVADFSSNAIKSIRYRNQDQIALVIIDLYDNYSFEAQLQKDAFLVTVYNNSVDSQSTDTTTVEVTKLGNLNVGELQIKGNYSLQDNNLIIPIKGKIDYSVTRLTTPNKIILDITNYSPAFDERMFGLNSNLIGTIMFTKINASTLRMTVTTKGQKNYYCYVNDSGLVFSIIEPTYKSITYTNSDADRVVFNLDKVQLTNSSENIKELFTREYDSTQKQFKMTFSGDIADLGAGRMNINDDLLNYLEVSKDAKTNTCTLLFDAKDKLSYHVIARFNASGECIDTAITLLKPAQQNEKLIVIDPGHGGYEPGAKPSADFAEKDLNLDIAKRVNTLLKAKGIKTYITRERDEYIDLYERAYIANMLNATLFVCIHNNANDTDSMGTETLYFPNGPKANGMDSQKLAGIIQNSMISELGTVNRGLQSRPGLVVLRKTTMPAVLVEVGFMDNASDRKRLKNEEFKQKSAQSIVDGIIKALGE